MVIAVAVVHIMEDWNMWIRLEKKASTKEIQQYQPTTVTVMTSLQLDKTYGKFYKLVQWQQSTKAVELSTILSLLPYYYYNFDLSYTTHCVSTKWGFVFSLSFLLSMILLWRSIGFRGCTYPIKEPRERTDIHIQQQAVYIYKG